MRTAYPILLTPAGSDYIVYVPDLDIHTEGHSIADAVFMAEDAISLVAITIQDEGLPVPEPSTVTPVCEPGDIMAYALVDFDAYRREHCKSIMKRVSISSDLNELATKAGLDFSAILQDGLMQRLGVQ